MHALVTRALRNVGDDLIHQRGRRLIEHLAPQLELTVIKGWQRLDAALSPQQINRLEGIIVPGGPGARRDFYKVYPFLEEAEQHRIPVRFLGVGSRFLPGTQPIAPRLLDGRSTSQLQRLSHQAPIGVRDHLTQRVLQRAGIFAQVNGCPAWYSIEHLDTPPCLPKTIASIAFTPPADVRFVPQCIELMRTTKALLPSARVLVGFHHGISVDDSAVTAANLELVRVAKTLGFEVADLAADSRKLIAYEHCDLHLGYRVHAHIFFASLRKPTFLLAEDSRGLGVLQTLGGEGLLAWNALAEHELPRRVLLRLRSDLLLLDKHRVAAWLELALTRGLDLGFPHVEHAARVIDQTFRARMAPFVRSLSTPASSAA